MIDTFNKRKQATENALDWRTTRRRTGAFWERLTRRNKGRRATAKRTLVMCIVEKVLRELFLSMCGHINATRALMKTRMMTATVVLNSVAVSSRGNPDGSRRKRTRIYVTKEMAMNKR